MPAKPGCSQAPHNKQMSEPHELKTWAVLGDKLLFQPQDTLKSMEKNSGLVCRSWGCGDTLHFVQRSEALQPLEAQPIFIHDQGCSLEPRLSSGLKQCHSYSSTKPQKLGPDAAPLLLLHHRPGRLFRENAFKKKLLGGEKGKMVWRKESVSVSEWSSEALSCHCSQQPSFKTCTKLALFWKHSPVHGQWGLDFCLGLKARPSYK